MNHSKNKIKFLFFVFFCSLVACKKIENPSGNNTTTYEKLNGNYSGFTARWTRGFDSTGMNVVESRDTLWNQTASLTIDIDNDLITFAGFTYFSSSDLQHNSVLDTVRGSMLSTHPNRSIMIVSHNNKIIQFQSDYSASGPYAYSNTGFFDKQP